MAGQTNEDKLRKGHTNLATYHEHVRLYGNGARMDGPHYPTGRSVADNVLAQSPKARDYGRDINLPAEKKRPATKGGRLSKR